MARIVIQDSSTGEIKQIGDVALPFFPGWVLVDTIDDEFPPTLFYTGAAADARYVNVAEISDPDSPGGVALRAASVAAVQDAITAGDIEVGGGLDPSYLEGVDLWVYGHSYTTTPGIMCTAGQEFFNRASRRFRLNSATSYGVASSRMFEIAQDVLGVAVNGVAGSTWPGAASRKGVVLLDGFFNDQNNGNQWTTLGTQQRLDFQRALTLFLAVVGSASRVDDTTTTKTGTWTTNTFAPSSGGTNQQTAVQGSTADFAVTVPAGVTKIYYVGYNVTSGPGVYTLSLDGTVVYDRATDSNGGTGALTTGRGSNISVQGYVVPITVTAGAHTVRVTKTDATTKPVFADVILIPSLTPPPVIVMRDGPTVVTATHPQPQWDVFNANKAQLDAILDSVAAGFPNVIIANPGTLPTSAFGTDKVHPNDRGMRLLADTVETALLAVPDSDQLYKTV